MLTPQFLASLAKLHGARLVFEVLNEVLEQ